MPTVTSIKKPLSVEVKPVNGARTPWVMYQECGLISVSGSPQDARSKPMIYWLPTNENAVHGATMAQVIARADDPGNKSHQWFHGDVIIRQGEDAA